jgi:hypothetical protein
MMQKQALARVLRAIAAAIDSLDQEEVDQLIAGKGRLTVTPTDKPRKNDSIASDDSRALWQKLNDCKDRNEARQVLSPIARRDALASFAKMHKIHVTKQDRREDIENKLIEFVIGGKLRTEAIQTLNLKSGSRERPNG